MPAIPSPEVLYRHRGIAVVSKPSGLPSQPARKGGPDLYTILSETLGYVGLHHRLDLPASGLLLVTTDRRWNQAVSKAFKSREISRSYMVALLGDPGKGGLWETPLDGKEALTRWRRTSTQEGTAVVEVSLETGRTHQIRRHAMEHGHPVLGDRRYGGAAGRLWPRLALHAHRLVFTHPATGEKVAVEARVPEDLGGLFGVGGQGSSEM